jgi:hypothetical protein
MDDGLTPSQVEKYILETNYGIMPRAMWLSLIKDNENPFSGLSKEDERKAKRRLRKIKRKLGIRPGYSANKMWQLIDDFLREKELK